nr:histidine kinase [Ramlibacter sp. 2FC]
MPPNGKRRPLRLLHLENSDADRESAVRLMKRAGLAVQALRVDSERAYLDALGRGGDDGPWDLVLSSCRLPGLTGLAALERLKALGHMIPFVLVSDASDEPMAVEAMRQGASDYLLKDNLTRLVPAVLKAMERHVQARDKQQTELALLKSRQQLRELAQHLQNNLEQERAAIAREIHDDVGGALTALKFDLAWIARHTTSADVFERTQTAADTLTQAFDATRRLIHNLHPAILEEGLVPALQWITGTFEKRTGIRASFHSSHAQPELARSVLLTVFRTAQEALTNVSKHAQASQVTLDLTLTAGMLSLEVSDNGRGMSQAELNKTQSFGLRGLRERADTIGGWLDISSAPAGTTLILALPLKHKDKANADPSASTLREVRSKDDPTFWGDL